MATSEQWLSTWQCFNPECRARNLEVDTACAGCHRERPLPSSFREALAARALPAVDLEEFLQRNVFHENPRRRTHRFSGEVHVINNQVYLALSPEGGEGRVWHVEGNDLTPCDSHGRASW